MIRFKTILLAAVLICTCALSSQARERRRANRQPAEIAADSVRPAPPSESRTEDNPPTLLAPWPPVKVVHYVGIRGGYGFGSIRLEPTKNSRGYSGLINFGVVYKFDVPEQKYVGTIQAELSYIENGFAYETFSDSKEIYSRRFSTIEFPIMWQPYLPISKNGSRIHLNAGPYLSYALNSTYRIYDEVTGETISEGNYYYDALRDNRFNYGIAFGAGFFIVIKRFAVTADFRYNIGMGDILKGVTKYPGNPFRSPVDQMNVSLGVSFRL